MDPKANPTLLMIAFITVLCFLQTSPVLCFQFEVGGSHGWAVPVKNDSKMFNEWASDNRFLVGDTILFKYKKDSVMAVTETEYKNCNSSHPIFFSNTGSTVYALNHSGSFYFISGVYKHCQKGQRVIVKVMSSSEDSNSGDHSSASSASAALACGLVLAQFMWFSISMFVSAFGGLVS